MYYFIFYIIQILIELQSLEKIETKNQLKSDFETAYRAKDWKIAMAKFELFEKINAGCDEEMTLNAAGLYLANNESAKAEEVLKKCNHMQDSNNEALRLNQLALISVSKKDTIAAIKQLKTAIELKNDNIFALYNYEFLKKKFSNKKSPPRANSDNSGGSNPNAGGRVEKSEEKTDELKTINPPEISQDQALRILESMKSTEKRFVFKLKNKDEAENFGEW